MPLLQFIELTNFKSYKGKVIIGPLKSFNAVIGPNGSGKSNFVDAIRFILGEQMSSVRVGKLRNSIHSISADSLKALSTSVSAIFRSNDGALQKFTRSIDENDFVEHQIDGQRVSGQQFLDALKTLNININRAKDFLNFQRGVVSEILMEPQERTKMFESVSGSANLEKDYKNLKEEMSKAQEEADQVISKQQELLNDQKEMKRERRKMESYQLLESKLKKKRLELYLFRLYHDENEILSLNNEIVDLEKVAGELENEEKEANGVLRDHEDKLKHARKGIDEIDEEISVMEVKIKAKKLTLSELNERVILIQDKLTSTHQLLRDAYRADEAYEIRLEDLESKLNELEIRRRAYEEMITGELQNEDKMIQLEDYQVEQYHILKAEARRQAAFLFQELMSLNRNHRADRDELDHALQERNNLKFLIETGELRKAETQRKCDKLEEYISAVKNSRQTLCNMFEKMKAEVDESKNKVISLQHNLNDVNEKLYDAKFDEFDVDRRKQKGDVIVNLREAFRGVHYRLSDMCEVIHDQYRVAVMKVMGKYADAIVVDNEITARKCIQYLKNEHWPPEIFLSITSEKLKPSEKNLRDIEQIQGARLLHDVLKYDPIISCIVQFVTNNTLVCETSETAEYVAFHMVFDGYRPNVVSLDGTFYRKSDVFSGGSVEVSCNAKCWQLNELRLEREELTNELFQAMKHCRREFDLKMIDSQRNELTLRLESVELDKARSSEYIDDLEKELESLRNKLKLTERRIERIEEEIKEHSWNAKIEKSEKLIKNIEEKIFVEFCNQVRISNLQQYEDQFRIHQERAIIRLEFENEFLCLKNKLESIRNTREVIGTRVILQQWKDTVNKTEHDLKLARLEEVERKEEIEVMVAEITQLENLKSKKISAVNMMEETVNNFRGSFEKLVKKRRNFNFFLLTAKGNLERNQSERYRTLNIVRSESEFHDLTVQTTINYSLLPTHFKELYDPDDIRTKDATLVKEIAELSSKLQNTEFPNAKLVLQQLEEIEGKLIVIENDLNSSRSRAKEAKRAFEKIKERRYREFMSCFNYVSEKVDSVYKALSQNQSAQAFLELENTKEPYLGGVNYNCVVPGKPFQLMSNLSESEKTVAALALLFAIHSHQPAPVFVLDGIDAALDDANISKVAAYVQQEQDQMQTIIISLKEGFFARADCLIGITSSQENEEYAESEVYSFDLTRYLT